MREQLESVKSTLNHIAPHLANASTAAPTSPPPGIPPSIPLNASITAAHSGPPVVETLLEDIAGKLAHIEHLYTDMTTRIVRVDSRLGENERSVRELQHISAGALNETARLVEYVGRGATTPPPQSRLASHTGNVTPPANARGAVAAVGRPLDYVPGSQLSSTIQQHASQIHKLIAGLDFLEQHIIRQDQVIEGVQKQLVVVSR